MILARTRIASEDRIFEDKCDSKNGRVVGDMSIDNRKLSVNNRLLSRHILIVFRKRQRGVKNTRVTIGRVQKVS